ncbi:MAG: hypothetical protein U1A26_01055 [Candidatus Sungbacteria bacterium]|nr:hypothetical protein [Candidatus Sungbacteria bacterium]
MKMTIEKLAEMTRDEFGHVRGETKEMGRLLNEKMDGGFMAVRREMQENTRAILAGLSAQGGSAFGGKA